MSNVMSGIVEAVGDKFNGSLKVNGTWVSNKKGFKNPAKVGDKVKLTLESWESNGKTGENISAVDVVAVAPVKKSVEISKAVVKESLTDIKVYEMRNPFTPLRDFDSENRGKVRHGLTVALVPLVATESINVDKAKEVVNSLVEFVMTGK